MNQPKTIKEIVEKDPLLKQLQTDAMVADRGGDGKEKQLTDLEAIVKEKKKQLKREEKKRQKRLAKETRLKEGEFQDLPSQFTPYPNHRLDAYDKHIKTLTQLKMLNWLVRNSWGKRGPKKKRIKWVKLPTYKELGKKLNISAVHVYRTLRELKRVELIREDDRGRIGIWRLFPRKTEQ